MRQDQHRRREPSPSMYVGQVVSESTIRHTFEGIFVTGSTSQAVCLLHEYHRNKNRVSVTFSFMYTENNLYQVALLTHDNTPPFRQSFKVDETALRRISTRTLLIVGTGLGIFDFYYQGIILILSTTIRTHQKQFCHTTKNAVNMSCVLYCFINSINRHYTCRYW